MRRSSAASGSTRCRAVSSAASVLAALAFLGCGSAQVLPAPGSGEVAVEAVSVAGAQLAAGATVDPAAESAVRPETRASTAIYLVRHAEKESDGTSDPALTTAGRERAALLARMLAGAGLTAIHSTPYRRTLGTAEPVARAVGLQVREYDPGDLEAFASRLLEQEGRHLVVGHSNTTPDLVRLLGGEPGSPIPEDEYDRIYLLMPGAEGVRTSVFGFPRGFPPPPSDSTVPRQPPNH